MYRGSGRFESRLGIKLLIVKDLFAFATAVLTFHVFLFTIYVGNAVGGFPPYVNTALKSVSARTS